MATTVTNAMGGIANPASFANRIQTFFSKKLLAVQIDELVMDQFALKTTLQGKTGAHTIRFFKPSKANTGHTTTATSGIYGLPTDATIIQQLTEGTPVSAFRENAWTYVDVPLFQYGAATKISDVAEAIDLFNCLEQNIDLMGRECALHTDTLIRNSLVGSNHPKGGGATGLCHDTVNGSEVFAASLTAVTVTTGAGTGATAFGVLSGLTGATAYCNRLHVLSTVTGLKIRKAPKISGRYICCLPPQVQHDLMRDSDYKDAFNGMGAAGVYKGELGTLDGVRFVEHTNPFIEDETYGTYDAVDGNADGLIYSSIFLGAGAYGVPDLAKMKHDKPHVYVNNKPDKSDPLNQFTVAGWKAFYMAHGLDVDNIGILRTKSTYA